MNENKDIPLTKEGKPNKMYNNKFWLNRSKQGRSAIFEDPKVLEEEANKYFELTSKTYWYKEDFLKAGNKAGKKIKLKTSTPFTLKGLTLFLGVNSQYFSDFVGTIENMKEPQIKKDFSLVVTRIRDIVSTQKLNGAMVGAYNSNIVARLEGLTERTDITSGDKSISIGAIEFKAANDTEQQEINELKQAMKESTTNK